MMNQRFKGRTALITGGGTGIGGAVARRLAQDGANVVLLGRRREPLERVAAETGAVVEACDAADATAVRAAVARLRDRFGSLDILVANAGGAGFGPTERMADEDWAQALRANLDTVFVSARESLPALMAARGSIAIVSSIAGLAAMPDAAGYVTAKHACIGLGRSLARDFGRRGVRTNVVCPGWVRTEMADEEMRQLMELRGLAGLDEAYALVTRDVPLGRAATPEEVANLICFLCSDEASAMNGSVVTVDGGSTVVDLPSLEFYQPPAAS